MTLRKAVLGESHMDTLMSMNNLAEDCRLLMKYQEALRLDQKTLDLREKFSNEGKDISQERNIKYTLITVRNLIKDCEALALYKKTLELKVKYDFLEKKIKNPNDITDEEVQDEADLLGKELKSIKEAEDDEKNIIPPKFGLD